MRLFFLLVTLPVMQFACHKGTGSTVPSINAGDYAASNIIYVDSPVMYTSSVPGYTKDQQVIKSFLTRHGMIDSFSFSQTEKNPNPIVVNFSAPISFTASSFTLPDSPVIVRITSNTGSFKGNVGSIRVLKAGTGLEGFRFDVATGLQDSSTTIIVKRTDVNPVPYFFTGNADPCWQIIEYYRGLSSYAISCPNTTGNIPDTSDITKCSYIQQFPILSTNGQLKLPQTSYLMIANNQSCQYQHVNEWNYFFDNKIKLPRELLKSGDTLVVQNKNLYLY